MPGKGNLLMTGQMGDADEGSPPKTALTYVRSICPDYGGGRTITLKSMIYISIIPEGAVPKGTAPSAGITMATAMLSAVVGRKRCAARRP